jgi:hypothetical protein
MLEFGRAAALDHGLIFESARIAQREVVTVAIGWSAPAFVSNFSANPTPLPDLQPHQKDDTSHTGDALSESHTASSSNDRET